MIFKTETELKELASAGNVAALEDYLSEIRASKTRENAKLGATFAAKVALDAAKRNAGKLHIQQLEKKKIECINTLKHALSQHVGDPSIAHALALARELLSMPAPAA